MNEQIINVGSLNSLSNLNYHLTKELKILRDNYLKGNSRIPVWDLTNLIPSKVSFSALTAFLSVSKTVRDFIGKPIEIRILWHPEFQGFLYDIDFIKIAQEFDLYDWKGMYGGITRNKTSPNTRIFYYSDFPTFSYCDTESIINWKDYKREEIKRSIYFRIKPIYDNYYFDKQWNKKLEAIFTTTISELVVNSLIHGRSISFVGVQRTRKGISTCVTDNGIGFFNSLKNYRPEINLLLNSSNLKSILYSSFQSKNKIGLYRAINDVIDSGGYINISSFDAEIMWKEKFWSYINNYENSEEILNLNIEKSEFYIDRYVATEILNKGYMKKYPHYIIGSRIIFEIPFEYV